MTLIISSYVESGTPSDYFLSPNPLSDQDKLFSQHAFKLINGNVNALNVLNYLFLDRDLTET